ncbi:Tn7 transposase TnsA N-terminal domain-containing protein [Shewanella corallii]|uniref:Tn7 transposase TnsA N-terminal domain-containing protein n=1 Tax=Shewanella corallii TaxID=560080 RepID=A0ABT0NC25_9GAMM|nr:Tn7 transposase TnsA N-terminal domain-containing protein [Shewanella corallii]MCL2916032.1 Tn7 transposase TnsA N-terminal domain-containing protein [Shewanella corallii]
MYSKKTGGLLKVESHLELIIACKLTCNPQVVSFAAQPESLHCEYRGKQARYTPDFLVQYTNGTFEYLEVHPEVFIDQEFKERLAHFSRYSYRESGVAIRLVTDAGLTYMERENVKLLANRMSPGGELTVQLCSLPDRLTFAELIKHLNGVVSSPIEEAYTLVALGYYHFDRQKLLSTSTLLFKESL